MTSIDDIYKAIDGVRTRDLAGRLAVRGTGVAAKAGNALEGAYGSYDITNEARPGGFGGKLITPSKFENEPELFYGPFAQLGTYLGIENPVARFVVDAVFDPLNLATAGSGFLLNRVGRMAEVVTSTLHAVDAVGDASKSIDDVLNGIESGVKLATQSPEYLARMRKAATEGVGRKEWKSLIDEGLAAETTESGKELLGVLRGNRKAIKDLHNLAKSHGGDLVGDSLILQPTLKGRLMAGQVNPAIRIERPFARTRAGLTQMGAIGENSMFAVKHGDYFMYTPVSDKFVLGGGRFAESLLAKSGLQKGSQAVADKVSPGVALESVQDAGLFRVEADIERLLGNAHMNKAQLSMLLGNPNPSTQDDLVRQIQSMNENELRGMAAELGLDPQAADLDGLQQFALNMLDDASKIDDLKTVMSANARQRELIELSQQGTLPFSPNEELNQELNAAYQASLRQILAARDLKAMQLDPAGLGNALHSNTGMLAVYGNAFLTQLGETIEGAVRKTAPKIRNSRKLERSYREGLRFFRELPEIWTKDNADDVWRLDRAALEKLRAKHAGPEAEAAALAKELGGRKFYHVTDAGDEIRRAGKLDADFGDGEVYFSKSKDVADNRAAMNNSSTDGKWEVIEIDVESLVGLDAQRGGLTGHGREIIVFGDVPLTPKKQVKSDAPGIAMFDRFIARASENGIDMEAVLERQGFMNGMSEVVDMLADIDDSMLTEAARLGLHEQFVKNHYRRLIRPAKHRHRAALGGRGLRASVGGKEGEQVDDILQDMIDKAVEADPSLGKGKGPESVQKLRKATEKQLISAEKSGILEIEWDSLSSMADQLAGHQRSVLARQFTDELAMNARIIDSASLEIMNKHADFKGSWVQDWLKSGNKEMDLSEVTGRIPNVMARRVGKNKGKEVVQEPWEFMHQVGFKGSSKKTFDRFYEKVEISGGIDVGDDFQQARRSVLRGAASNEEFVASQAREELIESLSGSPALREKVLGKSGAGLSPEQVKAIVTEGRVPKGVREPAAVKKRVTKALDERSKSIAEGLEKRGTASKRGKSTVYVLKPMAGHLKDALNLWDKHGFGTEKGVGAFTRFWRDWNHRLKALKLNFSPFHLNVISFAGLLVDPVRSFKMLRDPLMKDYRNHLLKHQGVGAAGGAVAGAAMGDDEEDAIFGGVVGLLYGTAIGAAMKQAKISKNFLFDPEMAPYAARAGFAGWHGRSDDRAIGVMGQMMTRLSDRIKRDHGQTVASRLLDGVVGAQMDFERTMWDVAHNGHKMFGFAALAQQNDARLLAEGYTMGSKAFLRKQREYDRASMNVVNSSIGGWQASKLWNDPEWQRRAQDFLMSPDWTIGNILGAGNIFLNQSVAKNAATGAAVGTVAELAGVGFDMEELSGVGTLGGAGVAATVGVLAKRSMARIMVGEAGGNVAREQSLKLYRNAILGGYAFGNMLNYMNTGHWMWENPEGKELSIAMPGGSYFVTLGKPYTETLEFASATSREHAPFVGVSRAVSKISPLGQVALQIGSQRNGFGSPLVTAEQNAWEQASGLAGWAIDTVMPISLGRPVSAAVGALTGTEPDPSGRFAGSLISSAGFAVSKKRADPLAEFRGGAIGVNFGAGIDLEPLRQSVDPVNQRNLR